MALWCEDWVWFLSWAEHQPLQERGCGFTGRVVFNWEEWALIVKHGCVYTLLLFSGITSSTASQLLSLMLFVDRISNRTVMQRSSLVEVSLREACSGFGPSLVLIPVNSSPWGMLVGFPLFCIKLSLELKSQVHFVKNYASSWIFITDSFVVESGVEGQSWFRFCDG